MFHFDLYLRFSRQYTKKKNTQETVNIKLLGIYNIFSSKWVGLINCFYDKLKFQVFSYIKDICY